ncbi:glycosyl transferase GT4 family protein [Methanobrevibacter sp. YE315]|uniref:glycosyltransferase n=1 Tax=Methanobrevibacter sp. YE315 TaxID=1609968 RepID=UPI000764DEAC|nr:glycosyltransferase [Methanobrevibacter sp. YE315]AMD18125.1 glycosyl transferase GT4 family protein [Methanobrevibacter sp. YE315]
MNILHVVPSFAPCFSAGGVVNASYQIAKKQVEKGHNVSVYTTDSCQERLKFKDNYNVNVDGINVFYFKNASNNIKNNLTIDTPINLPNYLRKTINNFDIIHIHEHRHSLAIATHRYAKKNDIPYVLQAHGSVLPFFQKEKLKEIFDKIWGFDILYDANKVFALTDVEKQQYLQMGVEESKIEIVPLGINLDEYKALPQKGAFKTKYGIKDDEKIILFLGRIHEIKGLDLLIKSFNKIPNEKIKLAIVGGDYGFLNHLENLIEEYNLKDKVIFPGVLVGEAKKEALVDCDIFVMPSRYESFTTSGLEAMACKKPLILTKNNHISDWVDDNVGLVCDFDENNLSDCISRLIKDEGLCEKFGYNGVQLIQKKYNWDIIEQQIESIYKKFLQ